MENTSAWHLTVPPYLTRGPLSSSLLPSTISKRRFLSSVNFKAARMPPPFLRSTKTSNVRYEIPCWETLVSGAGKGSLTRL